MLVVSLIALLATIVGEHAQVEADSPAALDAARRLLAASHFAERQLPPPDVNIIVSDALADCMDRNADQSGSTVDCAARANLARRTAEQSLADYPARRVRLLEAAAHIYAAHFSAADMLQAAAFYESSTGQRMISDSPAIECEFHDLQWREALEASKRYLPQNMIGSPPK